MAVLPHRAPHPFYRSPFTRVAFIITGAPLAWVMSPWGPQEWHESPSLHWLHLVLPWSLLSGLFAVYVILQVWGEIHAIAAADFIGSVLYGWEFVALAVTAQAHRVNPIAIAAMFLAFAFHLAALRLAIIQAVRHER